MKTRFFVLMILFIETAYAVPGPAIIGGQSFTNPNPAYAASVTLNGTLVQLSGGGLPLTDGSIQSVAINSSGAAIIGGRDGTGAVPAYAALVAPNGALTQLSGGGLPSSMGIINSVAINSSGAAIIGGGPFLSANEPAYAALVAPNGTLTQLSGVGFPSTRGSISSVAINSSGAALIGGFDSTGSLPAYAALVAPNGTLTQLSGGGFPSTTGVILSVAINSSGAAIIGGQNGTLPDPAYAALVAPNGTLTQLSGGGLPSTHGVIYSVAINSSGAAIIGGQDGANMHPAYAALVAPNGTLTQLSGGGFPSTSGIINSVAINSSGAAIIGGGDSNGMAPAYAALVAPNGTLTQLSGGGFPSSSGIIYSVAIYESGAAIIGGVDNTGSGPAYAALVAPNGTLTQLSGGGFPSMVGQINSVAIANPVTLTPQSIGPYTSVMNMQLAATYALETHLIEQSRPWIRKAPRNKETAFLVSASDSSVTLGMFPKRKTETAANETEEPSLASDQEIEQPASSYSLWAAPFGDYVHQKAKNGIPSFNNEIAGILVGFDYRMADGLAGLGVGYAFNYVHYGQSQGHGKINEEMACAYGLYSWSHCWINAVLWGGLYQLYNERHTVFPMAPLITSTAHTHGWVFSPHLEAAAPFEWNDMNWFTIEPFLMFDWVNNWQNSFTERGSAGFNLVMKNHYASLLRSEVGLRFYELFDFDWGRFLIEEKASYVNQAPFHFNKTTTFFVASASTFPIAIGSTQIQNLGGVELRAAFLPWNQKMPYVALSFQGEFGSSYQSYFANLEIGRDF